MDWIAFAEQRPTIAGSHWFRIAGKTFPGTECTVEWVDEVASVGMGYGPNELWPRLSHWDGYSRTVPKGLQWRPCSETDEKDAVAFPGLSLLPCPFCGRAPKISCVCSADGGGIWATARPYQANTFLVECRCPLVRSSGWKNLASLATTWNRRFLSDAAVSP